MPLARLFAGVLVGSACLCAARFALPPEGSGEAGILPDGPRPDRLVAADASTLVANPYGALAVERAPSLRSAPPPSATANPAPLEEPARPAAPTAPSRPKNTDPAPLRPAVTLASHAAGPGPPLKHGYWIYYKRAGHLYWRWHR